MIKVRKLLTMLREDGVSYITYKLKKKFVSKGVQCAQPYSAAEMARLRSEEAVADICFSILVPLYNTPDRLLREMIDSVKDQIYPNWELCLADGSDDAHGNVGEICKAYADNDPRIRYRKLDVNRGISGNTNACIEMATGDYIALFDHDDLLHPAALCDVFVEAYYGADFIYTDEALFYETPADAYSPHYKPDFSPDTLRSYN